MFLSHGFQKIWISLLYSFNLNEIKALIQKKEKRKNIYQRSIFSNWDFAKKEIKAELGSVYYYSKSVTDEVIEKIIKRLNINIEKK